MALATDGQGNFLTLDPDGKWVPAQRAKNDTGDEVIYDGEAWKPVPGASAKPQPTPSVDEYGRVMPEASLSTAPNEAAGRVGNAIVEGYRNTPDILTPAAREAVNSTSGPLGVLGGAMGRFIVNPMLDVAGAGLKGMNAVGSGLSQTALEGANALGVPALGRDINMLAQVAPAAAMPGFTGYRMPSMEVKPNALGPVEQAADFHTARLEGRNYRPAPGTPDYQAMLEKSPETATRPPGSALVPQSVGAASRDTATSGTGMTPAEAQASRSTGEMQRLMTTPQPGDATEYVPGVKPTKAEIELSPSVSREAKGLRQEFREGFSEKEKLDNEVYHDFYDTMAGTPTIVERMDRERGAQAAKDLAETWKNKAPADVAPVLQAAQEIKASPDWHRPVVRNSVDSVIKELFDGDKPITDPEQLYGVRKYLSDLLSKEAARETPMATRAAASLMQLRSALDGVIEQAAPGFGQYLKNFQEASRPIDVMERLQKAKTELTNGPDRVITFGKFDRLLKNLVAERADPDVTLAAKAIPEDTMGKLFDMWRSIQRSASDQELAKTRGSDTTQMMLEMGKQGLGQVAATVVAPGLGNFLAPILGKQLGGMFAKRKVERHLHPDITPYQNRLLP